MGDFKKTTIAILDENDLFREGMKRILDSSEHFEVVGAASQCTALQDMLSQHPEIILIDASLNPEQNEAGIQQLLENHPFIKVVFFSDKTDRYDASHAFQLGVKGFFTKDMHVDQLLEALESIQAGSHWIHPYISNQMIEACLEKNQQNDEVSTPEIYHPTDILTRREYEVLTLLASGYNNKQIADHLAVTQSTVKNHVTNIFIKMKVNDRTQAVIKAALNHWVEIKYEESKIG
ncbi:MAG TPA: response regulator transcription factor [Pseudogracilibacillus sp.]|nr:response regulator transcription factor [Pseudogracilibacillus sp.]